jgi:hypothetical protein
MRAASPKMEKRLRLQMMDMCSFTFAAAAGLIFLGIRDWEEFEMY